MEVSAPVTIQTVMSTALAFRSTKRFTRVCLDGRERSPLAGMLDIRQRLPGGKVGDAGLGRLRDGDDF